MFRRKSVRVLPKEVSNRIKGKLVSRGMNLTSLAAVICQPYGSVGAVVNGYRENPRVRQAIARFLGEPVEDLFGDPPGDGELNSLNPEI